MIPPARTVAVALAVAFVVPLAGAQDGVDVEGHRAALLVTGDVDRRDFVGAFLSASLGQALGEGGHVLRPWRAATARLAEQGGDFSCSEADECPRRIARALEAPLLIFVDTTSLEDRRLVVRARWVRVSESRIDRSPVEILDGTELEVAGEVRGQVVAALASPPPCTLLFRAGDGATLPEPLLVSIDEGPERTAISPMFLAPTVHRLAIRAPDRLPASTEVRCAPGHRYAVVVR